MVENCPKIEINRFVEKYRNSIKKIILNSEIEAAGWDIELTTSNTPYNGLRFWFKCPLCGLRAGVLFKHPITNEVGCRNCLKLEYRKRRYKGMIEAGL